MFDPRFEEGKKSVLSFVLLEGTGKGERNKELANNWDIIYCRYAKETICMGTKN